VNYFFSYQILIPGEWWQRCTYFKAADDQEAVERAKHMIEGLTVKDMFLIPYERLVRV
jgi:hypothetical protein